MKCTHFERRMNSKKEDDAQFMYDFWKASAIAVAGAANCTSKTKPGEWANKMCEDLSLFMLAIRAEQKRRSL